MTRPPPRSPLLPYTTLFRSPAFFAPDPARSAVVRGLRDLSWLLTCETNLSASLRMASASSLWISIVAEYSYVSLAALASAKIGRASCRGRSYGAVVGIAVGG